MDVDNTEESEIQTSERQQTITELETRVEELETEIKTLKDGIDPLISVFLKTKKLAKGFGNDPTFDPNTTDSMCKILGMITKHVKNFEKTDQKMLQTNTLLKDELNLKKDMKTTLKELSNSAGLDDILAKLRIVFKLAGVAPGALFKTNKPEHFEFETAGTSEVENLVAIAYNAPKLDKAGDTVIKMEVNDDSDAMYSMPQASGRLREDGTYNSDGEQADDIVIAGESDMEYYGDDTDMEGASALSDLDTSEPTSAELKLTSSQKKTKASAELKEHKKKHPNSRMFQCQVCEKTFSKQWKLTAHMSVHGPKPFSCEICGASWGKRSRLSRHMRIHTKPLKCSQCECRFAEQRSLDYHMQFHEENKPIPEEIKKRSYFNEESVTKKTEERKSVKKSVLKTRSCQYCEQVFLKSSSLMYHIRTKHPGQNFYQCRLCDESFRVKSERKAHMESEHPLEKAFPCDVCGMGFGKQSHLDRHMKSHTGQRSFICDVCGFAFAAKEALKNHKHTQHNLSLDGKEIPKFEKKNTKCPICNKTVRLYGLKGHLRIHSGQKPFLCDMCPMSFGRNQALIDHKRRHTNDFNHPCPHCDKMFIYKSELNLHLTCHDPELREELTCTVCFKVLADKVTLEKHVLEHSDKLDNGVQCQQCDMMFHTAKACLTHVKRVHLGMAFKCNECGKVTTSLQGLNNHKRIHTRKKQTGIYRCSKCGDELKSKAQLLKHNDKCDSTVFVHEKGDDSNADDVDDFCDESIDVSTAIVPPSVANYLTIDM